MKKLNIFIILLIFIISLCACNKKKNNKIIILTTIDPIKSIVEEISDDEFEVITIVPSGSSPETYSPKVKDMIKYKNASLYFSIGLSVEDQNVYKYIDDSTKEIELDKEVKKVYDDLLIGNNRDPHIWLSLKRVLVMAQVIEKELSLLKPEREPIYSSNLSNFSHEIYEAEEYINNLFSNCENPVFITFHPAFQYFAEEFNIKMYSLENDGKESTPKDRIEIINIAKELNIKVIFYQEELSSKEAKSIAEEIGGIAQVLSPLSTDVLYNIKNIADLIRGSQSGSFDQN